MKFDKFIQENKKELEFDEDLSDVWSGISNNLPVQKKASFNWSIQNIALAAVTAAILLCALYFIMPNNPEVIKQRNFAQLDSQPPLAKILAIKNDEFNNGHSEEIIQTLLHIIKNDRNTNVRLAAIRAAEKYINKEEVKIALINLLTLEEKPYITVAVLNILQRGNVKESLPAFDKIIQNESHFKFVKEEAKKGQEILKNI